MSTDPSFGAVQTARSAAETIRTLGHQLIRARVGVADVYDILGELGLLTARMPHLLARLQAAFTLAADSGGLVAIDDAGRRHDPTTALVAIGDHLTAAGQAALTLTAALDAAHEHAARLADPGPPH